MASPAPPTRRNIGKHYILVGLTAIMAAAVVVTVFFVVLSPARIAFSITKATSQLTDDGGVALALTVTANNTSHRAAAKYQTLFVDVSNNTGTDIVYWVRTKMNNTANKSRWQSHGSVVALNATAELAASWATTFFAGSDDDDTAGGTASLVVLVIAAVRFRVAGIRTRLYDITVRCGPVTFVRQSISHGTSSSFAATVGCSPA